MVILHAMNKKLLLTFFCLLSVIFVSALNINISVPAYAQATCDPFLWQHTYTPSRLTILQPCVTITGRVTYRFPNPLDGDYHIALLPDPQFASFKNKRDFTHPFGEIILEPICQIPALLSIPRKACAGVHVPITIPRPGQHIQVTGVYVIDKENGGKEIHPVSVLTILRNPSDPDDTDNRSGSK